MAQGIFRCSIKVRMYPYATTSASILHLSNGYLKVTCEPKSDATPERVTIVVYVAASHNGQRRL
jgi:hypothetical protein